MNTQSPVEHSYIVTNTACNGNIAHDICSSRQPRVPFKIASSIKLDKFKGDGSQHPKTWWNQFQQWIDLYEIR